MNKHSKPEKNKDVDIVANEKNEECAHVQVTIECLPATPIQPPIQPSVILSRFENCFQDIKSRIDETPNAENIVLIIVRVIEIVETYVGLSGMQKKNMVIQLTIRLIDDSPANESVQKVLMIIVRNTGHQIIDSVVFASKGKLAVNKIIKNKFGMLRRCLF
jgi:hypothetical protein